MSLTPELTTDEKLALLDKQFDETTEEIGRLQDLQDRILSEQGSMGRQRLSERGILLNQTLVTDEDRPDRTFVVLDTLGPYWVMLSCVETDEIIQAYGPKVWPKG